MRILVHEISRDGKTSTVETCNDGYCLPHDEDLVDFGFSLEDVEPGRGRRLRVVHHKCDDFDDESIRPGEDVRLLAHGYPEYGAYLDYILIETPETGLCRLLVADLDDEPHQYEYEIIFEGKTAQIVAMRPYEPPKD